MALHVKSGTLLAVAMFGFFTAPPLQGQAGSPAVIDHVMLSGDGNYVAYTIENEPAGGRTVVVKATHEPWQKEWTARTGALTSTFADDSRHVLIARPGDTVTVVTLDSGRTHVEEIPNVSSCLIGDLQDEQRLICQRADTRDMVVRSVVTGQERNYGPAERYWVTHEGYSLIIQRGPSAADTGAASSRTHHLDWIFLSDGHAITFWSGLAPQAVVFDPVNRAQMAFLVDDTLNGQPNPSVWYYTPEMDQASLVVNPHPRPGPSGVQLAGLGHFVAGGSALSVMLKPTGAPAISHANSQHEFAAILQIATHWFVRLEWAHDSADRNEGRWVLVHHHDNDSASAYLISTATGEQRTIDDAGANAPQLSPEGAYAVYYDPARKNFFSYEVSTGMVRNITQSIRTDWTSSDSVGHAAAPPAGWTPGDSAVFLYDRNDVWLIDPSARKAPVNVTHGYGRQHDVVFRIEFLNSTHVIQDGQYLLLTAFNRRTKENGFFRASLGVSPTDPTLVTTGPYVYDAQGVHTLDSASFTPVKAKYADVYLVRRTAADAGSEYFITTDFRTLIPVINPRGGGL